MRKQLTFFAALYDVVCGGRGGVSVAAGWAGQFAPEWQVVFFLAGLHRADQNGALPFI